MDRFDERLLEPVKAYESSYKAAFRENAEKLFDSLLAKSGVDVQANRETVRKYNSLKSNSNALGSQISGKKTLRTFLVVLIIAAVFGAFYMVYGICEEGYSQDLWWAVAGCGVLCILFGIFCGKLKKTIAGLQYRKTKVDDEKRQTESSAWSQMQPLNSLFDSHMTQDLMEKTVPMLDFDYLFSIERYSHLHERYGFQENSDSRKSTIGILSGEINGNPFVIDKNLIQSDGTETYYGSIVIHWTTIEHDDKGSHTVHHTQTLTASVTKFKPVYGERTTLIYGNDGAPDLHFTRTPSHIEKMDDKELKRFIARKQRKIEKKSKDAIKDGGTFTAMTNSDFDTAFGAFDRDHEVQFRLMFTPLAQNNMMDLMRDSGNYGDDFVFRKEGPLNYISSEHSQMLDMDTDNSRFGSYDVDACRRNFIEFNCSFFRSVFFDFAPLLCVPLYQQTKPHGFIYKDHPKRNYTDYEAEFLANRMGEDAFRPTGSVTQCILKTNLAAVQGSCDKVNVTAHSYRTEDRVDMIPRMGGDGHMHMVPVHWKEYIPVTASTNVWLKDMKYSDNRFRDALADPRFSNIVEMVSHRYTYSHGLLCMLADRADVSGFDRDADEYRNSNRNSNLNNNICIQDISIQEE